MTDAITREEKLMKAIANGSVSNIKPITREEMFLAKAGGQDVETPEPITRREKLLQGIIDNGGGGGSTGGGEDIDALIDGSISGEISSNVKTLRSNAFTGCTLLTSARFPLAEGTIKSTFEGCSNLETVDLPLMTKITGKAFNSCTNLKQANLQSVTEIDDCTSSYDGPFFHCDSLENVILTSLKSMGSMAFYSARGLSFIDLPSLTSIRSRCFVGCEKFTTMVLRSESVVTLSNVSAFSNTPFIGYKGLRGTFYVKQHLIEEYKTTATNWPALYAEGYCDFLPIEGSEYE